MKQPLIRTGAAFAALLALLGGRFSASAGAQAVYHNTVNQRFRAVGNGPQSALIVDVTNANDPAKVAEAVRQRYAAYRKTQGTALSRMLGMLRQKRVIRPDQQLDLVETAIVRQNGRLARYTPQRTRVDNELTFTIPTSGDGAWSVQEAANLSTLTNLLYNELKTNVLGIPGWNGNVTILNKDPDLGTVNEIVGALLVVNVPAGQPPVVQIWLPSFNQFETKFLALAQVMAQAFHGPYRIGFDSWEKGMARAAAVVAARDLQPVLTGSQAVNPNNGFFYTPYYDLLNQPSLGNDTFTPPTKGAQAGPSVQPTQFGGMIVPRLQMSSTAWLKCFIENANFFKNFNAAYYAAVVANANVANDTVQLRNLAAAALPTVEGLPFSDWYEQQYVLDTSVTPGRKLFLYTTPDLPQTGSDSGVTLYAIYYNTVRTSTGVGDEKEQDGTANMVYWDYTFSNRLALPGYEQLRVNGGFGSVAPFFNGIGGTPADQMRVAIDVPINRDYARLYFPAGKSGTIANPSDLFGVVIGADTGTLAVNYDGGTPISMPVVQGAFGAIAQGGGVPNGFSRTRIVFTPRDGSGNATGAPVSFVRNTAFNNDFGVAPVFVLYAPGSASTSIQHTFLAGPQLISLPLRPYLSDFAQVLGTVPAQTLVAQYRQDLPDNDKFLRYPSLPLYQPGYALWSNFTNDVRDVQVKGERTDLLDPINVALTFGWNMIGSPYNNPTNQLNASTDLTFQYLGGDVLNLRDAVTRGWVAAGIIGFSSLSGYQDITTTTDTSFPRNIMETWKGYWIRVLVSEGLVMTVGNPANRSASRSRAVRSRASNVIEPGAWQVPLTLRDANGNQTSAALGQSQKGSDRFTPSMDVASPPAFTRAASLALRFAPKEGEATSGSNAALLVDVRRSAAPAQWEILASTPSPEMACTLSWNSTATLPRGTRLTLTDTVTGAKQLMNSSSGLSFQMGKGETTRRFVITAEHRSAGRIRVSNIAAVSPPATGGRAATSMTISYELSSPAETQVAIRMGGRVVRRLSTGRAAATGVNQFIWDMRDDQGRTLPAGAYLLEIMARSPEGDQTRTAAPILITR